MASSAAATASSFTYHHGQHLNMSFDQELELMYVHFEQIGLSTLDTIRFLGVWLFPICFVLSHIVAYFMNNHQQEILRLFISVLQRNNLVMLKQVIDELVVDEENEKRIGNHHDQEQTKVSNNNNNNAVLSKQQQQKHQITSQNTKATSSIPKHIAVIMDGNRRYGKQKLCSSLLGHRVGGEKLRDFVRWCRKAGVEMLTVYAFSTENWSRPKQEVDLLMELFSSFFEQMLLDAKEIGIRIRFISSEPEKLPTEIRDLMRRVELHTRQYENDSICVNVCASYGSRSAIEKASLKVSAAATGNNINTDHQFLLFSELAKSFVEREEEEEQQQQEQQQQNTQCRCYVHQSSSTTTKNHDIELWSSPDMLIRTSGEIRLSNFMLLELAYTEMFFWNCTWPEVTEQMLGESIDEFSSNRNRRMGK